MIKLLLRTSRYMFATQMDIYYHKQPNQLAVIFGNSNSSWTHRVLKTNSQAVANGFKQNNFMQGDSILVRLPYQNDQQKLTLSIASAHLKTKIFQSKANNIEQLQKQLRQTKARAFIFSSFDKLGDTTVIDGLYRFLPEMMNTKNNNQVISRNFNYLRYLIQLDNYRYPGTFKYSNFVKYTSNDINFNITNFHFECPQECIILDKKPDLTRPIVITNPLEQQAFRAGVLNCVTNGSLLVCINPKLSKFTSQKFQHNIDIICTQPMEQLHSSNRVFVKVGSKLYEKHPKRYQLEL